MKYIDYRTMKDFYTIDELCRLFEIDRNTLRHYTEKYHIMPEEDQYGNWGFRKVLVRKLHNFIYKEQYNQANHATQSSPGSRRRNQGPWDRNEGKRGPWD